jgi:hypothetical protein
VKTSTTAIALGSIRYTNLHVTVSSCTRVLLRSDARKARDKWAVEVWSTMGRSMNSPKLLPTVESFLITGASL